MPEYAAQTEIEYELTKIEARRRLLCFTKLTKDDYRVNWHHRSYAEVLDKFIEGKIKRLMVFMPPQHGKSELCSRRMPAKLLGNYPDKRIAVISYNHTFASKFNRSVQRIIDSREYAELFPGTRLWGRNVRVDARGAWLRNADEFEVVGRSGSLISTGIGGPLTGNKVDVAIIDDPYKDAQQANSEAYRRHLEEWWDSVMETRLHNDSQICLTLTRWRHDDIAGRALRLAEEGITLPWTVVVYEALKETPDGPPEDDRKQGQALWPEHLSVDELERRRAKNPAQFEALYQQRPTPKGGNAIKDEWFFRYELHQLPKGVCHAYIDTATSEKELNENDPTGILIFQVWKNKLYLTNFMKGHWSLPELKRKIEWVADKFLNGRASKIHIENKSNARSVKQELEETTSLNIFLDNIKGGKMERVENEQPTLEAGRVGIPINEHWTEDFLAHLCGFPLMKHDEEVDCLTGAIRKGLGRSTGMKFANTPKK